MLDPFTRHPEAVGETYAGHAATAAGFGVSLILAGLACLVHAAFPWLFEFTASRTVRTLHERMSARWNAGSAVNRSPMGRAGA